MEKKDSRPVLIVDDNPMNRFPLAAMLKKEGYTYEEASGGREALEMVSKKVFSLILMDLIMPGIDGLETIRQMRRIGVKTPIVALSAMSFKQDIEDSKKAGGDAFLSKPAKLSDIKLILNEWAGREHTALDKIRDEVPKAPSVDLAETFRGMTALLVENDPARREDFVRTLSSMNLEVHCSQDGQQAWEMLESGSVHVDIVISNLFTEGIDALGLLIRSKRLFPEVLFFIYTETYDSEVFQLAISKNVDGIIPVQQFQTSICSTINSAIWKHKITGSSLFEGDIHAQVRHAQSELIGYGCPNPCPLFDMAYAALGPAGGDMARCRRFNQHGRCGIILADVAGHDVLSSYISAIFLGILLSVWDKCQRPRELVDLLNREMLKTGYDKTHVCVTAVLWDQLRGTLDIAIGGNPGALVIRRDQEGSLSYERRPGGGLCLGLLPDAGLSVYDNLTIDASTDLFFFSDGIDEDDLEEIIATQPSLLGGDFPLHECGRFILEKLSGLKKRSDDMILLHLKGSGEEPLGSDSRYSCKSTYENVDQALAWAESVIAKIDVPSDKDRDFILISVRELLLNAVEHGNERDPEKWIDLSILPENGGLKVMVSDEGSGFDLQKILDVQGKRDGFQIGKRGLPLIQSIADSVKVEGGSVILFLG